MARNTIRNKAKEDEEIVPAEDKTTKPKKNRPAGNGRWAKFIAFIREPRVQKISGIFLVLTSVFLLLAFVSYLISGQHDFRLVTSKEVVDVVAKQEPYKNWMGKIGANVAWFFMSEYFGVGAIFIPLIVFMKGIRIWLKRDLLPYWKTIRISLAAMFILPLAVGFLFHEKVGLDHTIEITCNQNLVGGYGHFATQWSVFTLGWFGTLMLLTFTLGVFLIFNFNHHVESVWMSFVEWWKHRAKAIEPDESELEEEANIPDTAIIKRLKNDALQQKPINMLINDPIVEAVAPLNNMMKTAVAAVEIIDEPIQVNLPEEKPEMTEQEMDLLPIVPMSAGHSIPVIDDADFSVEVEQGEEELDETEISRKIKELGPFDPKRDLPRYILPSIDLLKAHGGQGPQINKEELEENKNRIVETLNHYKIEISKIKASIGPTVTLYEIIPAPGVRISKIKSLEDDIALSLAALGIRIIAPIPGKGTVGIEVPNSKPDIVSMRSLIASEKFQNADMELPIVLGKTISNENFVADLAKMPHLLMAGATGQGKSVGLNAILVSLLYKKHPSEIKFVLVDPKKVELTLFNKIERHFLAKLPNEGEAIITDVQKVVKTLTSLCIEMDQRYELLKTAGCRNIKEYNVKFVARRLNPENGHRYLPYIVLVVDEFADLIMTAGREVEMPMWQSDGEMRRDWHSWHAP